MTSRWKRIAIRSVQTSAQRRAAARLAGRLLKLPARGGVGHSAQSMSPTEKNLASAASQPHSAGFGKDGIHV